MGRTRGGEVFVAGGGVTAVAILQGRLARCADLLVSLASADPEDGRTIDEIDRLLDKADRATSSARYLLEMATATADGRRRFLGTATITQGSPMVPTDYARWSVPEIPGQRYPPSGSRSRGD